MGIFCVHHGGGTKMNMTRVIFAAACVAGVAVGCSHQQTAQDLNRQDQLSQATGRIPDSPTKDRDAYAKKVDNRLNDYTARVNDLQKAEVDQQPAQKADTQRLIDTLQLRAQDLKQANEKMKAAGPGDWQHLRDDVDNYYSKAEDAYNATKQIASAK
jgi:hypothetical protein